MEWFAITSTVTTSLAWAGADARARGARVSVADVCRQTMTGGRIVEAKDQMKRVCRLARVGVGDLRAAIDVGLLRWDGNDLVVVGWDQAKEREATRAVKRAREHRAQKSEADASDLADTPAVPATPSTSSDAAPTQPTPPTPPPAVRAPFAYAPPYTDPNSGTEKRRGDQTREETPPPSPQGITARDAQTAHTATAATAQGRQPEVIRDSFANDTSAKPRSAPPSVRERNTTVGAVGSEPAAVHPPDSPPDLAPKRSSAPARRAVRLAALGDDALGTITALGGCLRGPGGTDYTPEWRRELVDLDAREALGICCAAAEPIRLPSGLRRELAAWKTLPIAERRAAVERACRTYDLPMSRRPEALS